MLSPITIHPASLPRSSIASALTTLSLLSAGIVLVGGGLFFVSDAIGSGKPANASLSDKIGPTFAPKQALTVVARRTDGVAGEMRPPLLIERMAPIEKAVVPQDPAEAAIAPIMDPPVARSTPAGAEQPVSRSSQGAAGCTRYRTYDPRAQTYRGFDGKIHTCSSDIRSQ